MKILIQGLETTVNFVFVCDIFQYPILFQLSNVIVFVFSSATSRLCTEDMQVYTSVSVWMLMTIICAILKQYTILLRS
jgi:hypothetical protein